GYIERHTDDPANEAIGSGTRLVRHLPGHGRLGPERPPQSVRQRDRQRPLPRLLRRGRKEVRRGPGDRPEAGWEAVPALLLLVEPLKLFTDAVSLHWLGHGQASVRQGWRCCAPPILPSLYPCISASLLSSQVFSRCPGS